MMSKFPVNIHNALRFNIVVPIPLPLTEPFYVYV